MTIILRIGKIKDYFITAASVRHTQNMILMKPLLCITQNSSEIFLVSVMIFDVHLQVVGLAIASVHLHRLFTVMLPQLKVSSRKPLIGPVKVMASRKWNILLSLIVASVCAGDQTLTPVEVEQLPFS